MSCFLSHPSHDSLRLAMHLPTTERFYRVEPSLLMTKPQFITAMRRCFGDEILESENSFGKLFESFDFECKGKVDWRALLYMLMILLQADMTYLEHLKHAFCLYASQVCTTISYLSYELLPPPHNRSHMYPSHDDDFECPW